MSERMCVVCWHLESLCECVSICDCCGEQVCSGTFLDVVTRDDGSHGYRIEAPSDRDIPDDVDWGRAIRSAAPGLSEENVDSIICSIKEARERGR